MSLYLPISLFPRSVTTRLFIRIYSLSQILHTLFYIQIFLFDLVTLIISEPIPVAVQSEM